MANPTYSTGTVSVTAGGTVVTGIGTIWSGINAKAGDSLYIGAVADPVEIKDITDVTHLTLWAPWAGSTQTSVTYTIVQDYPARVVGVAAAQDVGTMLGKLHTDGLPFLVGLTETVPDPSLGADGQYAYKPDTGAWWVKTAGVWTVTTAPANTGAVMYTGAQSLTDPQKTQARANVGLENVASVTGGNAFTGLQGVGSGAPDAGVGVASTGNLLNVFDGEVGGPYVTTSNPSAYIYRTESFSGPFLNHSAALEVGCTGIGVTGGQQTQAISAIVAKDVASTFDACAVNGVCSHAGTNGTGFGGFFAAINSGSAWSIAVETETINGSGTDYPYQPTPGFSPIAAGLDVAYVGTNSGSASALGSAAILIRSGGNQWDVGIGMMNGSPIKSAEIQSDTNSVRMYYAHSGSHTHGIDLTGATFSGNAFASPSFSVAGNGVITTPAINASGNGSTFGTAIITNTHATAGDVGMFIKAGATSATNDVTTYFIAFNDVAGTNVGGIRRNGVGAITYLTTSDQRLKTALPDEKCGLDQLRQIRVRDFYFNGDTSHSRVNGVFAQELYETYPYAVSVGGDDPVHNPWGVDYGRLTPLVVKSVQELAARLDVALDRIKELEKKIGEAIS